jgi:hypothetical protein
MLIVVLFGLLFGGGNWGCSRWDRNACLLAVKRANQIARESCLFVGSILMGLVNQRLQAF